VEKDKANTQRRARISTRTRESRQQQANAGYSIIISYMVTTGSESENGLFAGTVTTGAMAAMATASFGFYTHDAVVRLLLRSSDNNAGNARVEGILSTMEQSMQQQQERETSVLNQMSVALDVTNAKLEHLDKALARSSLATTATRRRATRQQKRQAGALRVLPDR
jgi:phage head maturation protease